MIKPHSTLAVKLRKYHSQKVPLSFSVNISFFMHFLLSDCWVPSVCSPFRLFVCVRDYWVIISFWLSHYYYHRPVSTGHYWFLPLLLMIELITVTSVHAMYFLNYPEETCSFQERHNWSFWFSVHIIIVMWHLCPNSYCLSLLSRGKIGTFSITQINISIFKRCGLWMGCASINGSLCYFVWVEWLKAPSSGLGTLFCLDLFHNSS